MRLSGLGIIPGGVIAVSEGIRADRSINIKGLVCPITFVRAKLAIEDMEPGEVLEVLLDFEEASRSIPKSMAEHGHEVLGVRQLNETDWVLHIRKVGE